MNLTCPNLPGPPTLSEKVPHGSTTPVASPQLGSDPRAFSGPSTQPGEHPVNIPHHRGCNMPGCVQHAHPALTSWEVQTTLPFFR